MRVHQLQATMRGAPASIEMCFASATDQIQGVSRQQLRKTPEAAGPIFHPRSLAADRDIAANTDTVSAQPRT